MQFLKLLSLEVRPREQFLCKTLPILSKTLLNALLHALWASELPMHIAIVYQHVGVADELHRLS